MINFNVRINSGSLIQDTLSIFYPSLCAACDDLLVRGEDLICTKCLIQLPRTAFHLDEHNPVAKQFWGKVNLEAATAYFHFHKGELVQQLVHKLKYQNSPEVGVRMGMLCGADLLGSSQYASADMVIPVPLHPKKQRIRGYNQAACFGEGLATAMGILHLPKAIKRKKHTDTQTKKSRFARFKNVAEVFLIRNPDELRGKKILLVDDVITTGSTLTACAKILLELEGVKVLVVSMAFAEK
ncbi:ComF family protein [soil metagenome]